MISVTAPLWVGLLVGVAFGVPASIWGIGNPETIIRTARLVDRLLLGCFLLVTAVGSVLLYGLYAMGFAMHFSPRPVYLVGVTIGGLLFGVGAASSGYFPGTEMIALGEGRREMLFAIPGGLLGAAAWTLLYQTSPGHWLVNATNLGNLVVTGDIATNAFRPVIPPSWRNRFGPSAGKRAAACLLGSFLVLFGARMAGGCTSGHTLSGGVQLALSAWLFTAAMLVTFFAVGRFAYRDSPWQVHDD